MSVFEKRCKGGRVIFNDPSAIFAFLNQAKNQGFTIVELLIVITILAIVAGAISVNFGNTTRDAEDILMKSEMQTICDAFVRFRADCLSGNDDRLDEMRKFGLWPLFIRKHPNDTTAYPDVDESIGYAFYDPEKGYGWAGPYLIAEGHKDIDSDPDRSSGRQTFGQETESKVSAGGAGKSMPVALTPWNDHYRLMAPYDEGSGTFNIDRMIIVSLGPVDIKEWDESQNRLNHVDKATREQELLSDLQTGTASRKGINNLLSSTQPDEDLEMLSEDYPQFAFKWLMPSDARK